jgi:hypothetical protein
VTLGELHLDHEQDLVVTLDMWVQALAALPRRARPRTWDDGVDGTLLCHLLFSVHVHDPAEGAAMLRFRCGPVHTRCAVCVEASPLAWPLVGCGPQADE